MNLCADDSVSAPAFHPALSFTRFTARSSARLSKHFSLVGNVLDKQGGGNMTDGIAERLTLTLADFAALLPTLKPNQATSYGIAGYDAARVVVADAVSTSGGDRPVIARTRDYFSWPVGPGLMMLDYDAPADGDALTMNQLRDALALTCLPLDSAPAIWRPSASSCIHVKGGAELRGIAGQRLYIPVIDASDLSRAGQVLFDRLWLAGYGRYELSKSGAFLARSPIDANVFQPERLDFCGGASLGTGLEQRLPEPIIFNPDAPYLDTRAALPDLTADERARLTTMQDAAKSAMTERQAEVREQWVIERVGERLATMPEPAQETARPRLEAVYRQAVDGGWLAPGFELTVKAKGSKTINKVTVGDALAQKTKYHEATCLDPLEPDYPEGAGRFVGWLNLKHKPPYITSQAHGGTKYFLGVAPAPAAAGSGPERQEDDPGCGDMPDWFTSVPFEPVVVSTKPALTGWKAALMFKRDSDQLLKNHYNAVLVVENAYPGLVGYNEFRQRIEARLASPWRKIPGQWTEADTGELAFHVSKEFTSFTLDQLAAAVMTVAYRHPFNPAQERLRALADQWDGMPRLDNWLIEYLGAAHNASNEIYLREIGSAWLKGVAARVLFPGCKRDDVLILRSEQGYLKSTAALAIAEAIHPDSFTDSLGNLDSKDSKAAIRGIIIAELGELSVLNKTDLESIKVYVATRTDHFREAYGRGERDYPRTVSFIGTTNHPTFLKDPTGNRRFWPVTLPAPIGIERFTADLPQLLGEAARRVILGEQWYVNDRTALAQAEAVRAAHFQDDVWTEAALNAAHLLLAPGCTLDGAYPDFVTVSAILSAMGVRIEQHSMANQTRIGGILRVAGWTDRKARIGKRSDNKTVWAWFPPVVPPIDVVPPVVPPAGARQTAAVPPVPPGSPYPVFLTEIGEAKNHSSESNDRGSDDDVFPAPAISPFYENRGNRGNQGEPLGKQWIGEGEPVGGTRGNQEPKGGTSCDQPDSPYTRSILETLKASPGGTTRADLERRMNQAHPKAGALLKTTIDRLLLAGRIGKQNDRLVAVAEVRV